MLDVRRFDEPEALGRMLCEQVAHACARAAGRYLALAVGESTLPHYAGFEAWHEELRDVTILPVDELVPAPDAPGSALAVRLRASLPPVLAGRFRPIRVRREPEAEAAGLERDLEDLGLAGCVLGLGRDGHVAMNQPGSGPDSVTRVVDVTPANLARLGEVAPARRMLTLGMRTILRAEHVWLVVAGSGKEHALARVLDGPEGDDVPATYLRRHPSACALLLDP